MKRLVFSIVVIVTAVRVLLATSQWIAIVDVRVLMPHMVGAPNPMTLDYAQTTWRYTRDLYYSSSYQQYDLSGPLSPEATYLPPYEVPTVNASDPSACSGYIDKAWTRAWELGYTFPAGSWIVVVYHDCPHNNGATTLWNPAHTIQFPVYYGEKPTEVANVLGYRDGIWNPWAWFCSETGCVKTFIDAPDVQGQFITAYQRFTHGWLTYAAGDARDVGVQAGQYTIERTEPPRNGQVKFLNLVGNNAATSGWSVEVRPGGQLELPTVRIYRFGNAWDTVPTAVCTQWILPVGSTFQIPDSTVGFRTDAINQTAATISVVENVFVSSVAAVSCGKGSTSPPPPDGCTKNCTSGGGSTPLPPKS